MTILVSKLNSLYRDDGESGSLRDRLGETDPILLVNRLVNSTRGELRNAHRSRRDRSTIGAGTARNSDMTFR